MKKERKEESFLKKPWYKGGAEALSKAIYSQLNYPADALAHKVEGVVRIKVDIDYQGYVVDAKIVAGLGFGCDEEAIRIAKSLKFEVAKTPRKMRVTFHKNLNIQFKLAQKQESNKVAPPKVSYQYTIAPAKPTEKNMPEKKSTTITYTLNIR